MLEVCYHASVRLPRFQERNVSCLSENVCAKAPVTVPPECTLEEAAGLMEPMKWSLLVVSGGELLGIVTDRDIVIRAVSTGQSSRTHVATVMSENPTVIQGSVDIVRGDSRSSRMPAFVDSRSSKTAKLPESSRWMTCWSSLGSNSAR